jgi:hypothetical protein
MRLFVIAITLLSITAGCASRTPPSPSPQDAFMARLSALCGQAFAGRLVVSEPAGSDAAMAAGPLIMHIRRCSPQRLEIPFHVGADRSRTWIITRTAAGLRLKHDHRHEDGSPDAVTDYGGDTADPGTALLQNFPVDAESIAMFIKQGRSQSITNVWTMELSPVGDAAPRFIYQVRRPPTGQPTRVVRVEFDLSRPVPAPPTPWGW